MIRKRRHSRNKVVEVGREPKTVARVASRSAEAGERERAEWLMAKRAVAGVDPYRMASRSGVPVGLNRSAASTTTVEWSYLSRYHDFRVLFPRLFFQ
jgi:hypothetical protein